MSDDLGQLLEHAKTKNLQVLPRVLTKLERGGPALLGKYPALTSSLSQSFRLGITGPPGAGKSTLINQLIKSFRQQNLTVGVLAVDPSSPFSQGAILGDRIRYSDHFNDPGVFIRSLGSRGSLGGLSAAAYLMLRAYDLWGFDIVLIETVGVGQTELEIMHVSDLVAVVLVPESGDSVQAMKAGLLEIADVFLVNKSDRPGAESLARELEATAALTEEKDRPTVLKTIATTGDGIESVIELTLNAKSSDEWKTQRQLPERLQFEAKALLRSQYEEKISSQVKSITSLKKFKSLF